MEHLKLRKNKLVIISLFEEAILRGVAGLQAHNNRIIVIKEDLVSQYPRLNNLIKGKIIRKILIKKEDCFLLIYAYKDRKNRVTINPGYIFYSNGNIYLEENWIEENCYWEDSVFSIFYEILQHEKLKFVDVTKYID